MYTKQNLLPIKTASHNSKAKPELQCVAFYGNRTIGTDSFRLLEVEADGKAHEPKLIDAKALKQVKLKKTDQVSLEHIEKQAQVPANPHANYPDVDIIIDRAAKREPDEYVEVQVNGRLLGELLQAMAAGNQFGSVTMRVPVKPYEAIYLETPTKVRNYKETTNMRGLCMPQNR